jgi:hypothetical protein
MDYYQFTLRIPKRPLKLVKFRISTVLLLMAVLAILLAWRRDHKQLSAEVYKLKYPNRNGSFSASQATGAPNTNLAGDSGTAWASETPDGSSEWLELEYNEAIVPTTIVVHESFNPGAILKITHVPYWGSEKTLWERGGPATPGSGLAVSRLPVAAKIKTGHIKIYLDSQAVPGWNEIDAVGLEDANKKIIWATEATASSTWPGNQWGGGIHYVF